MSHLTPEAKAQLSSTVRALRSRLLDDLLRQAEGDFRLALSPQQARLSGVAAKRRALLDAWIDERLRSSPSRPKESPAEVRKRALLDAVKEVAATWLNRIVLLHILEAHGLSRPRVVTGGWNSPGYRRFREFAPALLSLDATEGYLHLLRLLFEEHALDLPALFGEIGLERLFPLPAATLRELIEKLDDRGLESAWQDDTTLGWVYQYWNDPERESLDKKITEGGKIEPGEIASKTQMFTERYMVEWLLQNSLGTTWLCICQKNGWQAEAEAILPALDARRADWRARREAGEVALDALMPIEGELEGFWKYHVPQPIPGEAIAQAPSSIREVKLLDPACGSGHFLVIAFDLLAAMHREEARHRGEEVSDREIAERILEDNLHGVDIDPRAVQIAAAAVWLKARIFAPDARPARLNLVAPALKLGNLPPSDPTVVAMKRALLRECGIPEVAATRLFKALEGVDHLGTLLKVDRSIDEVIEAAQEQLLLGQEIDPREQKRIGSRESILGKLEAFLATHTGEDDLGLKLDGEQLAQGVRFLRIVRENTYDLVIGNPPYQGTSKMANASYVAAKYPEGKADLYAAFLLRGLELARQGGISALLTMRGWMFLGQYEALRKHLLHRSDIRLLGDMDRGAFQEVPDEVISVVMTIARRGAPSEASTIAMQPTPLADRSRDNERTNRKRAAVLAQVGRYEFDTRGFQAIEGEPMVYWWGKDLIEEYLKCPLLGENVLVAAGVKTGEDVRFLRIWFEVYRSDIPALRRHTSNERWQFYIKGAAGATWLEPSKLILNWRAYGLQLRIFGAYVAPSSVRIRDSSIYFRMGIAFTPIGHSFGARAHRTPSIIGNKGSSVFSENVPSVLCLMNSGKSKNILESLNPGIGFEVADVNRLPMFPVESANEIFATIERAFTVHESAREASVEFVRPGPSPWRHAQAWAQRAVDRPAGEPLPPYEEKLDAPEPVAFVSYAFGVAMGRFGANGEGILDQAPDTALPGGILFLSSRVDDGGKDRKDSLDHPACAPLEAAWAAHGAAVSKGDGLRDYLRTGFFAHIKDVYENRPIYFPLSSAKKSFVAWVSIHRFQQGESNALGSLLVDHLIPERKAIEADLEAQRVNKATAEGKAKKAAETRFDKLRKLADELDDFIGKVAQCADKGPPRVDKEPERETDARYVMDLDDGVMVNSSALWPLLEPQWKDPKKWWKELASAQGRKDYDWSHLAARYFPKRVADKCVSDPSLAVAHGCFWRLHPEKAYAWELRLQDEIKPDFRLEEPGSAEARASFLAGAPERVREIEAKERQRRERKADKMNEDEIDLRGLGEVDDEENVENEGANDNEAPHELPSSPAEGTVGAACHKALEQGWMREALADEWKITSEVAKAIFASQVQFNKSNPGDVGKSLCKTISGLTAVKARIVLAWLSRQEEQQPPSSSLIAARTRKEDS